MVKLPTTVGLGFVVRAVIVGVPLPMVRDQPLDGVPLGPFCTYTMNVPGRFAVTGTASVVAVLVITPFDTTQEVDVGQLVPPTR